MSNIISPPTFVDLPDDIFIQICIRLGPKDFLALIQTCRVLHAFALSDYVWHNIKHVLPLDLSSSQDGRLCSISAPELQAITTRALRLDTNWQRQVSRVLSIRKIQPPLMVVDMQPLGSKWLVTSHRVRSSLVQICVWRLDKEAFASCVLRIEPEAAFSFEAALQEEGRDTAIISVLGASKDDKAKGQLTIHQINLKGHDTNENPLGIPYVSNVWKIERNTVFYYAQISGVVVAAATVNLANGPLHQILLFNIQTESIVVVDSPILSSFDSARMQFKLFSAYIVVAGVNQQRIKIHVRRLPRRIFSSYKEEDICEDWDASIIDYETTQIRNSELHISPEPIYRSSLTSFTVMVTYSPFSSMSDGIANIYCFPIDTSTRNLTFSDWSPTHIFRTPPNATLEPICLGKTGLRAVWLSHQWNSDDYRLMRASFPGKVSANAMVVPLQPPDFALPFEPHTCRSLYFEEATGRVWVSVHTGNIFVLQF